MVAMDLLTLLNTTGSSCRNSSTREATPSSVQEDVATPPSTNVPTPSPEPSWSRLGESAKTHERSHSWESEESTSSATAREEHSLDWNVEFSFPSKKATQGSSPLEMEASPRRTRDDPRPTSLRITTDEAHPRSQPREYRNVIDSAVSTPLETIEEPDYRRHKFSDSHSSLASYSTSRSEAHSRISSVTTINEIPSIDSILSEASRAEEYAKPTSSPAYAESRGQQFANDDANPQGTTRSALVVPRFTRPPSPSDIALNMKSGDGTLNVPTIAVKSTSPSPSHPPLSNANRLAPHRTHKRAVSAPNFPPLSRSSLSFASSQIRPQLPPPHRMMPATTAKPPSGGGQLRPRHSYASLNREKEDTRPMIMTRHSESDTATIATSLAASRSTTPAVFSQAPVLSAPAESEEEWGPDDETRMPSLEELKLHGMQEQKVQCIFVAKCSTNSPVRKAVSHFFGRNKGTTLRIPEHIWLVYCRQHYQRLRYRLGQNYALHQLDLVKVVIWRIERWSQDNVAKDDGDEVQGWQIMLRKCVRDEQERWARFKQDLRRQNLSQQEQDKQYEDFKISRVSNARHRGAGSRNDDMGDGSNNSAAETLMAIESSYPWLLDTLGDDRSAEDVIAVIDRLRHDYKMAKDRQTSSGVTLLKELPPVEFLPVLSNDNDDRPVKSGRKRSHARANSKSVSLKRRATGSFDSADGSPRADGYRYTTGPQSAAPAQQADLSYGAGSGANYGEHPQMHAWADRSPFPGNAELSIPRSSHIVPRMQPMSYNYRSPAGTSNMPPQEGHYAMTQPLALPSVERGDQGSLSVPRPSHHRSASAFTPVNASMLYPDQPLNAHDGTSRVHSHARQHSHGDFFNMHHGAGQFRGVQGFTESGYQQPSMHREPIFDFQPRSQPIQRWEETEGQGMSSNSIPRIAAWPTNEVPRDTLAPMVNPAEHYSQIRAQESRDDEQKY